MIRALPALDPRVPAWDENGLLFRACPFCAHDGESVFRRPDELLVNRCDYCGAYYVSPAPSAAVLEDFYSRYYSSHCTVEGSLSQGAASGDPCNDVRVREIVSNLGGRDLQVCSVLDVGCGTGEMLNRFRQLGARVAGVDLDPDAVRCANEKLGLECVRYGTLHDCPDCVDVVLMMDFIEHPVSPLDELKAAVRLLNPGGLLVLWTPSAAFAADEEHPVCFRVDLEHMQYLTAKTCMFLGTALGLEVVHLETVGFPVLAGHVEKIPRTGSGGLRAVFRGLKGALRKIGGQPGRRLMQAARVIVGTPKPPDLRDGRYHLFCILRAAHNPVS